jgi:uncharacterized protein
MKAPEDAVLLRAFIGENDKYDGLPLYEAIVLKAREMHLAGATVLRGPIGFGHSNRIHKSKILCLSFDLPMIVEIVDTQQHVDEFLPALEKLMSKGIVTVEKVTVLRYGGSEQRAKRSAQMMRAAR